MVVRGSTKAEAERWHQALLTHVNYNGSSLLHAHVRPQPIPKEPKLFKDIVILDLGSSSVRAGILSAQGNKTNTTINHTKRWFFFFFLFFPYY